MSNSCGVRTRAYATLLRNNFGTPKTTLLVIVHHAHCLHECVADGCADEFKSTELQVFAHCVGFSSSTGSRCFAPVVLLRLSAHKLPNVGIETLEFLLDR